jgi:hypothetical protein
LRSERLRSIRSAARRPHSPLAARSFQHRIVLLLTAALLFATATLAGSGPLVAQVPTPTVFPSPSATPTPGLTNVGTNYFVDNDIGNDAFNCLSPTILPQPVSSQVTGPCKTI